MGFSVFSSYAVVNIGFSIIFSFLFQGPDEDDENIEKTI